MDVIAEAYAREYVRRRQEVLPDDKRTKSAYYADVIWLGQRSTTEIVNAMQGDQKAIEAAIEAGVSRTVTILNVVQRGDRYLQIDFETKDEQKGQKIGGGTFTAYLHFDWGIASFKKSQLNDMDQVNPFGWKVTSYSVPTSPGAKK
jgi:type IV secretory pathway component VirB8